MWNAVSSFKHYRPGNGVSRRCQVIGWLAILATLAAVPRVTLASGAPGGAVGRQDESELRPPGTPAPLLERQFTPRHLPDGTYRVTVLKEEIVAALRLAREALAPGAPAGDATRAWQVEALDPLEAFGTAGDYDRSKVARLYAGRRASVVRGPVERGGRVVAAVMLVSPYPDPTLSRLEKGTMVIVIRTR